LKLKAVLIMGSVLLTLILPGCSGKQEEASKTVQAYLQTITSQNWDKLPDTLSGEALQKAEVNTRSLGKLELTQLLGFNTDTVIGNENFAVLDGTFLTKQETANGDFISKSRQRFYLINQNNTWKIYSIETLSKDLENAKKTENSEPTQIVKQYINDIASNNYEKAVSLLTGDLQQKGIQSLGTMNKISNLQIKISNLAVEPLGVGQNQAYITASYKATNIFSDGQQAIYDKIMAFDLEKLQGKWYISKIADIK